MYLDHRNRQERAHNAQIASCSCNEGFDLLFAGYTALSADNWAVTVL